MAVFTTTLWASGGNNVAIVIPEEIVHSFGRGNRVPVVVTIDGGYRYRNTIASMGGQFLISFNADTRAKTGRGAGDEVEVTLELDEERRSVELPSALAEALSDNPSAVAAWQKLSASKQKAIALSIDSAKTETTRAKRVAAAVESLT